LTEQRKIQEEFDKKNAAGVAKELKKSEIVDWRNNSMLNKVTKMAISYFEDKYCIEDYILERNEKESNLKGNKQGGQSAKENS
jgi:hypothetical protein